MTSLQIKEILRNCTPWTVRGMIYPLHEGMVQRPTFPYLEEIEKSQWLSREAMEQLQAEKLTTLLKQAYTHCPWHRERIAEAGIDMKDHGELSLEDLQKLPTMDKTDARKNRENLVWREVPGGAYEYNTGGSSGQPLIFYYGRMRQASDTAGRFRAQRWWGVEVGDPQVWLWGAPVELNRTDRIKNIRDRLLNQLFLNAFEMSVENMDKYLDAIKHFRPVSIYGYATSLALLAARARTLGADMRLPSLKAVFTTGEPTYAHQRELIEGVFGVPVAVEFGSRDIGFTAHESPEGQMLLLSESHILEILDPQGRPVEPGQMGEAVITGLCSAAQPFIRYRTGDMVICQQGRCPSGRGLHVMGEIAGRSTDFVVRSDGTVMHALAVIYVLRATEGVGEFKFIQMEPDRFDILIVPSSKWSKQSKINVIQGIRARMGKEASVQIRLVDHIPPEASGKHRYVVSHVPLPEEIQMA